MKIYLAGIEGQYDSPYRGEIKNAFYSYYYMRKDKLDVKIKGAKEYHNLVFVDSGAHTFFSEDETLANAGVHQKKTKTKESPEVYFNNYVIWLKRNYQHYDYFAELDIGDIVGQELVNKWREVLKKENLYSKCVTVYHPRVMDWKAYIDMLEDSESKYVALEGDRSNRKRLPYTKLIKECYTRGIKVHGFAMTKDSVMSRYPFYSVDSTSWLQGSMYGQITYWDGFKIKAVPRRDKNKFSKLGGRANIKLLNNPDKKQQRYYEQKIGINAYQTAEKYYTKLWLKRKIKWD